MIKSIFIEYLGHLESSFDGAFVMSLIDNYKYA